MRLWIFLYALRCNGVKTFMDEIEKIKRLVSLMNESDIAELEMEEPDLRVKLKSSSAFKAALHASAPAPQHAQAADSQTSSLEAGDESETAEDVSSEELVEITSPMVGTFYRSPSDGAEPYVTVGSVVEPDTVVCIVEAMKVMNEVKADVSGEVVEILVQNAEPVEYGQELFVLKPSDDVE